MEQVAQFREVSINRFATELVDRNYINHPADVPEVKMPRRSTEGSAGYDIYAPTDIEIPYGESAVIPTGLCCEIKDGWALFIIPRSGLGFKTGVRLANTIGLIDSDYFYADNEGHIMVKLTNNDSSSKKTLQVPAGQAFCQGVFLPYGVTVDDSVSAKRTGGFGSTDE